jgi:hypothetical protein
MRNPGIFTMLTFILIAFSGCRKEDNPIVVDNVNVQGQLRLDLLFNLKEINNGYIIYGIKDSRITIFKLDINFKTIWKKDNYEWGKISPGEGWGSSSYYAEIKNIFQEGNGNFVCFCSIREGGDVMWDSFLIITLDASGNEINRSEIRDYGLTTVVRTRDKGYLLFGSKLIKLNSNLSKAWENNDQNYNFSGAYLTSANDGGFAVTGTWNSEQVFLQKLDINGNTQWVKKDYNSKPFNDLGLDVHQFADSGYLIIGRTRNQKEPFDMNCYIIRTDNAGDTLWTKKYGEESEEWFEQFIYATDDDFIIREKVGYPGDPIQKTILVRVNGEGQIKETKEISNTESMIFTSSGYFIKAETTGKGIITLSKVQLADLFK